MTRRVVITGMGTVNPLPRTCEAYWQGLLRRPQRHRADRAVRHHRLQGAFRRRGQGLQPRGVPRHARASARLDRFAQFALVASPSRPSRTAAWTSRRKTRSAAASSSAAASAASTSSRSSTPATSTSGPGKISPFVIPKMIVNAAAGQHLHPVRPVRPEHRGRHRLRLGRQRHRRRLPRHPAG